jgi:hypothetical protein
MAPQQQWKANVVSEALKETRVEVAKEHGGADVRVPVETEVNQPNRPTTPVRPVDGGSAQYRSDRSDTSVRLVTKALVQIEAEVPAPSQECSEVPPLEDDEEEMLDYELSPVQEDMDVNIIYLPSVDYPLVGDDDVSTMSFGPRDAIF